MKIFKLLAVLTVLFFTACKTTKSVTTEKQIDTLIVKETNIIQPKISNAMLIPDICDENGLLKVFDYIVETPQANISIKSKGDGLAVSIDLDSIKQSAIKEYKSTHKEKSEYIEKMIPYIPKWVLWFIGINLTTTAILAVLYFHPAASFSSWVVRIFRIFRSLF